MATQVELPFHLPFFPSEEGPAETPGHEHKRPVWHGNTVAPSPSPLHSQGHQSHFWPRTVSKAGFNYGISCMIWVPTPRPDLTPPDYFVPKKGSPSMLRTEPSLSRPLTTPSHGGKGNQPHELLHSGHHGQWVPTWPRPCRVSSDNGIRMIEHHVPCHVPSFKTIFVKHSSVVYLLCNHKSAIESWSLDQTPQCCCANWSKYRSAALNPSSDHWVLSGSSLSPLLPLTSQSSRRVLSRIRSFPKNGNSFPSFNVASSSGANTTAFRPCPNQ